MPKDISLHCTWKENLYNNLSLVFKVFLCIEELTWHKVINSASSVLPCRQHTKSVTGHFVSHDLFIYSLNQMGVTSKTAFSKSWYKLVWLSYGHFLLACREIVNGILKKLIWMASLHFQFCWLLSQWYHFNGNLMVNNNIITFFL